MLNWHNHKVFLFRIFLNKDFYCPADIYLLKFNNRNNKKKVWNIFKINNK